mgnify:CR=1 FL=1|tara:strand:- start:146359 stop:147483 length:1125 start_codon:yes stop_codon:yes gene_type:complete
MKSVYNLDNVKSNVQCNTFLDADNDGVTVARYDKIRYSTVQRMTEQQVGYFWQPEEVDLSKDVRDFKKLTPAEQRIFTYNLRRQILLDSIQGRSPNLVFLPVVTLPEAETFIETWSFFESIHNRSYSHIIRNVYSDPGEVFDGINNIQPIVDCAKSIAKYYDVLDYNNCYVRVHGYDDNLSLYEHKKSLWMALNAVNALEGIRFYVSFACSWAFAEQKKMEGNAKVIKFICRDENIHLMFTQNAIKTLPKEDPDFAKIREETRDECNALFVEAIEQEKEWAKFLFEEGSMIGLTEGLLCNYVEWIGHNRMRAIQLNSPYSPGQANPLPWTTSWIAGKTRQAAPQETELESYVIGEIDKRVPENFMKDLASKIKL